MGEATRLYPTIAKQKRQKQRLKANNAELAERLDETEDELQQAVNTANWNYECAQDFLNKLKNTSEALEIVEKSRDKARERLHEVADDRDQEQAARAAWKRTMIELFNEKRISATKDEIQERQKKYEDEALQNIKADKEQRKKAG